MNERQFRKYRIAITAVLAAIVGASILQGSLLLPAAAIITAAILMLILKRQVTDVLVDERIEKVAGIAAKKTLKIGAMTMAAISLVLIAYKDTLPEYAQAGYTLSYATCGLLLLYSAFYMRLHRKPE